MLGREMEALMFRKSINSHMQAVDHYHHCTSVTLMHRQLCMGGLRVSIHKSWSSFIILCGVYHTERNCYGDCVSLPVYVPSLYGQLRVQCWKGLLYDNALPKINCQEAQMLILVALIISTDSKVLPYKNSI